ncbi:ribonuclease P protein component [Aeromicrobium terrae]|nr:ribonuclease P protein component [Aeromicrobium terrae]
MRSSEDFRATVRGGVKVAQPTLVTHVLPPSADHAPASTSVGFVVSKAVGSAVDRNRVKRRLRHLMRDRLDRVPAGSRVVVRALPSAAAAASSTLGEQLDSALWKAGGGAGPRAADVRGAR